MKDLREKILASKGIGQLLLTNERESGEDVEEELGEEVASAAKKAKKQKRKLSTSCFEKTIKMEKPRFRTGAFF